MVAGAGAPAGVDGNVSELVTKRWVAAPHRERAKCHWTARFKMVPFTVCKFHLNKTKFLEGRKFMRRT